MLNKPLYAPYEQHVLVLININFKTITSKMKNEFRGRIIVTAKDIANLSGWGLPKCREFIRTAKEEQGLSENDLFTTFHLSLKLKVPKEELEQKLR
jgi:hypothetical protein